MDFRLGLGVRLELGYILTGCSGIVQKWSGQSLVLQAPLLPVVFGLIYMYMYMYCLGFCIDHMTAMHCV